MVSACSLYLDDIDLAGQKASAPDFLSALFQESDRIEYRNEDDELSVTYRASRVSVLKRLSLMGCTHELRRRRFEEWKQDEIASLSANGDADNDADDESNDDADAATERNEFAEELRAINALTWDEWRRRVPQVVRTMYSLSRHQAVDYIDRRLREEDYDFSWLRFDGHDSLLSLRAIVDACDQVQTVTLDVSALIGGGWIEPDEEVCADKIRVAARRGQPVGPTILLAEGKTDITVLKASIGRFHPDLVEFVTFLDHSEFRVDGGASYTVKFLGSS